MPLISTLAAASARGFGEFNQQGAPNYIENFFSTTLYNGTGAALNVNTGMVPFTTASWLTNTLSTSRANDDVYALSTATDSSGNVYIYGRHTIDLVGYYTFIAKYNSTGTLQWQKTITTGVPAGFNINYGNFMAIDTSNNIYVLVDAGSGNRGIIKFDTSGTIVDQKSFNGGSPYASSFATCITTDSSGNIYIGGRAGQNYPYIIKMNSSLAIVWGTSLFNSPDPSFQFGGHIYGIDVDSSGNVYACGYVAIQSVTGEKVYLVKLNSSGVIQWQKGYTNGTTNAAGYGVCVDTSGNTYMSTNILATSGYVVMKHDSSGNLVWQKRRVDTTYNPIKNLKYTSQGIFAIEKNNVFLFDTDFNIQWNISVDSTASQRGFALGTSNNLFIFGDKTISTYLQVYLSTLKQDGSAKNGTATVTISPASTSITTASVSSYAISLSVYTSTFTTGATSFTTTTTTLTAAQTTQSSADSLGVMTWLKSRSAATSHYLFDTVRGATKSISSNATFGQSTLTTYLTAFYSNAGSSGFSLDSGAEVNTSGAIYASWNFRRQPKFFDVVTYTGTGANTTITHGLGSVPGMILIKRTDTTAAWAVYHQSIANTEYLVLNTTAAKATGTTYWNSTSATSTTFSLGTSTDVNASGGTYVAYLFASNAGGFGLNGNDNAISCGTFTTDVSGNATVTLGYEPQFVIVKSVSQASSWIMQDVFGNFTNSTSGSWLYSDAANAELSSTSILRPTATGFVSAQGNLLTSTTYVYMAIRRGPMAIPTTGTSVFQPTVYTGTNANNRLISTTIAPDLAWIRQRNSTTIGGMVVGDRLRGQPYLLTGTIAAEVTSATAFDRQLVGATEYGNAFSSMSGVWVGNDATAQLNVSTTASNQIIEAFKRAPGFFDAVAYTGTGANTTISHNLGVAPELMLIKRRDASNNWAVYSSGIANTEYLALNTTAAKATGTTYWNSTTPTSTVFSLGTIAEVNASAATYMAYLFATCPGVSKVGNYKGTGTTQQVNCGFTSGARFVLIKRTDSTGDWYVYDTARGIIASNDPYILLNSTAAEVTTTDYVDPYSLGFELSSTAPAGLNEALGTTFTLNSNFYGNNGGYFFTTLAVGNLLLMGGYDTTAGQGGVILTSTNGFSWTNAFNLPGFFVNTLGYGNGIYVAGFTSGNLYTSTNTTTWTSRTSNFGTTNINSIAYGNGTYVIVGDAGKISSSTDAITWTSRTGVFGANQIKAVAYGAGLFVAGDSAGQIGTSPDGITWTLRTSAFAGLGIFGISYVNGQFVAVGGNSTTNKVNTSSDGITWTNQANTLGVQGQSVTFGESKYWMATRNGNVYSSTDALNWTLSYNYGGGTSDYLYSITYNSASGILISAGAFLGLGAGYVRSTVGQYTYLAIA